MLVCSIFGSEALSGSSCVFASHPPYMPDNAELIAALQDAVRCSLDGRLYMSVWFYRGNSM